MVANRPSAFLRVFSVPFFMHFVRGFAAWAFLVPHIVRMAIGRTAAVIIIYVFDSFKVIEVISNRISIAVGTAKCDIGH